ncbi:hypothetical protein [Rickettsiella massiliensis]|uniref:hypothetical protein n=1 Tax=Rickettsiella massiliensis TaxID=676517 RepID=UPI00029AFA02|nr:hypothetical protein [Rickettsiella massiliensis]
MIPLNHEIRYAQAGEGEDAYYLTLTSSTFNATIDNFAEDRQWDLLYLPIPITDIKAYKVSETLLIKHVNESMAISIKNYFFTSFYRHLIIMDAHQASFIPWLNESTLLPSLMPFFRATEHKKFFSFDTEKLAGRATLRLATRYKTIKFYREAQHLLLIGDNNLVVKLEAFYDHPNKLSIGFWYDHRQNEMLNPTQLYEFAKLAIHYSNELISLYDDQIIEYTVAAKNLTIQHHQAESDSTSVTKRFGILRFDQPIQVIVAKNQHDLLLSTDKSNITLKNWDRLDYRISAVRFGDDDDYFMMNNLEQFDLSQINSLQSLFNLANLQHLARKQLNAINTEVVNAIKRQLIVQGLENNYTTFHCLGFNSVDAEQAFLTLYLHLKMYHHTRHDHAVKAVIGLFVLGYSNVLVQNQGNDAATSMKQCFKTLLGDSLSDELISKLEKQTTEISEHLENNLKRFIASHHATIQENLSIAFTSMLRAEEAATDHQPRIRRDVSTHEIFSSPTQKTLDNKPLLTNKPASTTLNNYDVSFEQNFIFIKWLFGYVFKQGPLIQRMASIQKLAYQEESEESETSLVNINKTLSICHIGF